MTAEQLLRLWEESHIAFKQKKVVAALFLDAEAAFDRCWHKGIKFKMKKNLNLPDRIIRLLSSFLTDRILSIFYEGCYSHSVKLNAGTPQGSPLSPLIYIIYVNDYPEKIKELCALSQFADDTGLYAIAYNRAYAIRKLQKALDLLESWCRRWRVKLNGEKSKLIFITRTHDTTEENFSLHLFNDIIRPVKHAKFLGIEIDSKLALKNHFENISNRSRARLNVLKILSYRGVKPDILMKLYKCYVRPLIEYGSSSFIAAPRPQLKNLQQIQNEALRICLKLPKYIKISLLHEYASIQPIKDRLISMNKSLIKTMAKHNEYVKDLVENHTVSTENACCTPLDYLLA